MAGASEAASDRILLEPYKYLLQLPGETFSRSVDEIVIPLFWCSQLLKYSSTNLTVD